MSILVDQNTKVLVQGITGKEGQRAANEMRSYGTEVVAGVRPGKGGEVVDGIPVFNTVEDVKGARPDVNTSLITVPAGAVRAAALEAIEARIPLIVILAEHVPVQDSAMIYEHAKQAGVRVVGPSSVGIISPGKGKIGAIGSSNVARVFTPGRIGLISKSGGMTAEIANVLSRAGIGQSTVIGIGGDQIVGTTFGDLLELFENDSETDAIVMFGEIGGSYEEQAAECVVARKCTKPVIAVVAGKFTEELPGETSLGHAGAIVSRGRGSHASKVKALTEAGILIAERLEEIPLLLNKANYVRMANGYQHA